jgi:hypothetical protein
MNDKRVIASGLVIFLIVVTYPFWSTLMAGAKVSRPVLEKPVGETRCLEDKTFMRENHTQILNEWRTITVRNGIMKYTSKSYGTTYEISLTKTCLRCHNKKEDFCDRCHNYANVAPNCWNCHNQLKGIDSRGLTSEGIYVSEASL